MRPARQAAAPLACTQAPAEPLRLGCRPPKPPSGVPVMTDRTLNLPSSCTVLASNPSRRPCWGNALVHRNEPSSRSR